MKNYTEEVACANSDQKGFAVMRRRRHIFGIVGRGRSAKACDVYWNGEAVQKEVGPTLLGGVLVADAHGRCALCHIFVSIFKRI